MARRGGLAGRTQARLSDYTLATYGQAPVTLEDYAVDRPKRASDLIIGPAGKIATAGLKEFKRIQSVLGEGSRDNGFNRAMDILETLAEPDGSFRKESLLGARDALLDKDPRSDDLAYLRAHKRMTRANEHLPDNDATYPRTIDGYRGGLLAGTATVYGAILGEPMLGRAHRATTRSRKARWSPGNLVFGSGASVAGSTLDAIKEIVERSTDGLTNSTTQLAAAGSAIEEWRNLLASLEADRSGSLATSAIHAAQEAIDEVERATQTSSSASDLIKSWAHDL